MRKFKKWFFNRFLPSYAKEKLLEENRELIAANLELKEKLRERDAYINGIERGMRAVRKIQIINKGD